MAAFKDLTQLRTLYLNSTADENAVGDAGIEPLLGLKNLQRLSLGNTRLTAEGVRRLLALPALQDLSLTSPAIGMEAREDLKKVRPGVRLSISGSADGP